MGDVEEDEGEGEEAGKGRQLEGQVRADREELRVECDGKWRKMQGVAGIFRWVGHYCLESET